MNKYELKEITEDDIDFLFNLLKSSMMDYYKKTYGYWEDEEELRYLKESLSKAIYKIIVVDNQQIGCLALKESHNFIFVEEIQILPSMQNKGIGSNIIYELINKANSEKKEIYLEVLKSNTKALNFYTNNGFHKTGENETHFQLNHIPDPKGTTHNSE